MSDALLPIGHIIMKEGKRYVVVEHEPYTTKKGVNTFIYRFAGQCRHSDCREPVTPSLMAGTDRPLGGTACPLHKGWIGPEAKQRMPGPHQTREQKAELDRKRKAGTTRFRASLTPEEKKARRERSSELNKLRCANRTPEERKAHSDAIKAGQARARAEKERKEDS